MIGDSGVDMQTAHNAGIRSIGVTWGFRSREELVENEADLVVDNAEQLLSAILL
jgi:phosphoglycolate phosphatase